MSNRIFLLSLVVLTVTALFTNLGGYSIYLLDEAKNASCAREMLESGNWIVPTFNYELRADKPPLHYYFMGLSYQVFGVNAFSARFFSALFGLLTIILTYLFSRYHFNELSGRLASIVLLSSIGFIIQFRLAGPDPYFIFFISSGLFSFYHAMVLNKRRWFIAGYLATGLAVMSKGPVALVLSCVAIVLFVLIKPEYRKVNVHIAWGLLILSLVIVPWVLGVTVQTSGEWTSQFILEHNIDRFLQPKEGHGGNIFMIAFYFFGTMMPFAVLLIPSFLIKTERGAGDLTLFAKVVVLVVLVFFTFSATKLPNYTAPALPFAAILIGEYLAEIRGRTLIWFGLLLAILFSMVLVTFLHPMLNDLAVSQYTLVLFVATGAGILFVWKNKIAVATGIIAISWMMYVVVLFTTIVPNIDRENPINVAKDLVSVDDNFASYHIYNPAFSFLLKKKIEVFNDRVQLKKYLDENPGTVILTRASALDDLSVLELDTILISPDLFERTKTAILR